MEAGFSSLIGQLLNGLAGASSLFPGGSGAVADLWRHPIVNFAHGCSPCWACTWPYTLVERLSGSIISGPRCCWRPGHGVLGAVVEMTLLRRIYRAPELLQLLATFALVLVVKDALLGLGP